MVTADTEQQVTRRPSQMMLAMMVLLAATACGSGGDATSPADEASPADDALLDEVRTAEIEDRSHVEGSVDYDEVPPLGGPHNPAWANCGVYMDQVVPTEFAVHSMEHGAVWIAYPEGGDVDVEALRDLAVGQSHVLVSPSPEVEDLTATAWGAQLVLDGADDPALLAFIEAYVQGPQTPEPGAPCSGGVGEPA